MATTYQRIVFQPYMRDRFLLDRQGRRKLEQGLTRQTTAFYIVAGGSIRKAARRLLKKAGPKPDAELAGLVYGTTEIPSEGHLPLMQKPLFWAAVVGAVFFVLQVIFW